MVTFIDIIYFKAVIYKQFQANLYFRKPGNRKLELT